MKKWLKKWWFSILMFIFAIALTLYITVGTFTLASDDDFVYTMLLVNSLSPVLILLMIGVLSMPRKEMKNVSCGEELSIISRSNVIQFDEMGYPLRLCIVRTNKEPYTDQMWIDTTQRPNDIVLEWEKNNEIDNEKH